MTGAAAALADLGRTPLLVILDYDGTLAPISATPESAFPAAGAREALTALMAGPHRVCVVTGRPAEQVRALLQLDGLPVVGLHGLEWPGEPLPQPLADTVAALVPMLPEFAGRRVEDKGVLLAVHYRATPDEQVPEVEAAMRALPVPPGWTLLHGKRVFEFRPLGTDKGTASLRLARVAQGLHPVFIGDDQTDEDAFVALGTVGGVGIKVGEGPTQAAYRLPGPEDVIALLKGWAAD